jgi:diacylglycerol kinase family enzyme
MASLGPDAGVIRRLAAVRTRATGHAAYLRPVLAEAARPLIPRITLEADGRRLADARTGWLIVANARPNAHRHDPVPDADMLADHLDLVFIPATTTLSAVAALLRARARPRRWLRARARDIRVTAESVSPPCCQVDGELGPAAPRTLSLHLTLGPDPLKVLRPA